MKKYAYYTMLLINAGFIFYIGYNNIQLTQLLDNSNFTFYSTIFNAVNFIVPISGGNITFIFLTNLIVFNFLLVLIYLIFAYPFILLFGGKNK